MQIDLDAERAAEAPFVVVVGGVRHVGRPLSWPGYRRVELAAQAVKDEDPVTFEAALHDAFRAVFPPRWRYLFQPRRDPVWQLMHAGPAIRKKLVQDFFDWAGAWKQSLPRPSPMSGPSAPPPSLEAPTP